ncbi:aromatic-ring-hydroxylating dioxygenase subunit beta [Aromatoleum aromaticum]|uniref:aromatic-ring-hydroxylating dioxygenase subunit beta n=1 Tax=Aromatoleum aromaticum TaxID=551760 RepID=UPI002006E5DD|nr:aromatic-ring-hydroxylating dioxygenase subunit beta [Aromatoleum aromaticum]
MNMPTRSDVEDLLFLEADLLDSWKLKEWLALYTEDAEYEVPSADLPGDADPKTSLFYIADDRFRLEERVVRLNKKTMWSEHPRSKTRHLVSNVRILEAAGDELHVRAAFAVFRSKWGNTDTYVGSYEYRLRVTNDGLKVRKKRAILELESLRPQGRVSILL